MIRKLIDFILSLLGIKREVESSSEENSGEKSWDNGYYKKKLMTEYEERFYQILKQLKDEYEIVPQLNLASVVNKKGYSKYRNELFRNIDFAIFSKDYRDLLLLIEINDKTHQKYARIKRDEKVREICKKAGLKLITFYTNYPNQQDYVLNRVRKEINNSNDNDNRNIIN